LRIIFISLGSRNTSLRRSGEYWTRDRKIEEGGTLVKKLVLLVSAALVAMLILAPAAVAQGSDADVVVERTTAIETTVPGKDLPASGGVTTPSALLLPAAALLLGSGVVVYAFVRRR
jgi:hypothetical protein